MTTQRPLTHDDADRISVYEHLRWYTDVTARPALNSPHAADHLEELARVSVAVRLLDGWQAIEIHQAVLTGATLHQITLALGEPAEQVIARWQRWTAGQRDLWERWRVEDPNLAQAMNFDPAEHDQVAATLTEQPAASGEKGDPR